MIRPTILLALFLTVAVLAQDEAVDDESTVETAEDAADEGTEADDDFDVLGRSEDHTEDDEDVFIPSDEVSYQQSVPFPTDI